MRFSLARVSIAALFLTGLTGLAIAQVWNLTNYASTIAVTNTFQDVFPSANPSYHNCVIQNKSSSNDMYVYVAAQSDPTGASATTAKSALLKSGGQPLMCGESQGVVSNKFFITGTSGDAFYAARW